LSFFKRVKKRPPTTSEEDGRGTTDFSLLIGSEKEEEFPSILLPGKQRGRFARGGERGGRRKGLFPTLEEGGARRSSTLSSWKRRDAHQDRLDGKRKGSTVAKTRVNYLEGAFTEEERTPDEKDEPTFVRRKRT